jgi:transcriptional regulator with XRE-family HTH domain
VRLGRGGRRPAPRPRHFRARYSTQQQLAASLGLTQPGISRIENETDLFVSTLRNYVEALGGELEISAIFEDLKISIKSFSSLAEETSAA